MDHDSSKRSTRIEPGRVDPRDRWETSSSRRDGAEGDDDRARRGEHGVYYHLQWDPAAMRLRQISDSEGTAHPAGEMLSVYQAVDTAIGELLNGCPHEHTSAGYHHPEGFTIVIEPNGACGVATTPGDILDLKPMVFERLFAQA